MDKTNSKFTINYVKELMDHILEKNSVFVIGPNGMGKSSILSGAINNLQNRPGYRYLEFDMKKEAQSGALQFYSTIIHKIISSEPIQLSNRRLSSVFFEKFAEREPEGNEQLILFFDHVESVNNYFYDQFSKDCRKIINAIPIQKRPIFVFCGSKIAVESRDPDTSPLWNITKHIEIKACKKEDQRELIIHHYIDIMEGQMPDEECISFIANISNGHLLLIRSMIRFITTNNIKNFSQQNDIIVNYLDYSLSEKTNDKKLVNHFQHLINYLKTTPLLVESLIDVIKRNAGSSNNIPERFDNITITGILTINSSN